MAQKADAGSRSSSFFSISLLRKQRNECIQKAKCYRSDFESATDETKGFKSLLLMDLECLEAYISDTRMEALLSFRLSVAVAIFGSLLLLVAIGLGFASQQWPLIFPQERHYLDIANLSAVAGLITQFISGVFFYFYNMTLRQINLFHAGLESSRKVCVSLYLQSLLKDSPEEQNKARLILIKLLASAGRSDQLDQASEGKQNKKPHKAETVLNE